jgi:hypothetical protein
MVVAQRGGLKEMATRCAISSPVRAAHRRAWHRSCSTAQRWDWPGSSALKSATKLQPIKTKIWL